MFLVIFGPFYSKTPISQNKVKQVGTRIFGPKWLKLGKSDLWAYQKSSYYQIFEFLSRGPGIARGNFFQAQNGHFGPKKNFRVRFRGLWTKIRKFDNTNFFDMPKDHFCQVSAISAQKCGSQPILLYFEIWAFYCKMVQK